MSRRRWVKVTWPIPLRELGRRMQLQIFSENADSGFLVDRIRDKYIEGRFIERVNFYDRFLDPIGRELQSDRVEFYQTHFIASASDLGLEIIDASKGVRLFVNQVSSICDNDISLSNLCVDPLIWGVEFQKRIDVKFVTDSLQISDLMVLPGVKAKVVLAGSTDVQRAAVDLANGRTYRIEKLKLSSIDKPKIGVVLSSNGVAATFGKYDEGLVSPVRDSLARVLAQA